jgi:hypothetical protein
LIDQSLATHDLRIAVVYVAGPASVNSITFSVAAPGVSLGTTMSATFSDAVQNDPSLVTTTQIVQFFDDTKTFVSVAIDAQIDALMYLTSYSFREVGRGNWPYNTISGTGWIEQCMSGAMSPALTHPLPFAVLTDTGDIYLWQFDAGVDGETIPPELGHVEPGSQTIQSLSFNATALGVYVVQPSGNLVELADSNCMMLGSSSLQPQLYNFGNPVTSSTRTGDRTAPIPGGFHTFSADKYYYSQLAIGTGD